MRKATLALAALALAGCPPRAPPPDLSLDPEELLAQVRAAQARVTSVRGEVRLSLDGPAGSGTAPAFAAAARPGRVYVQVLDFFGNAVSVLAAADGALSLYDARERVLYRGPATPESLGRLVPVPLSPDDLAVILCGSAPLLDGRAVRAEAGRGFVTLELAAEGRRQVLRVGAGAAILAASLRVADGPGSYDLAFERLEVYDGRRFPGEVALAAEAPRVRMKLVWVDAEPGAVIEAELFSPPVPRGARVEDLDGAAPPAGLIPDPPGPRE